MMEEVPSLSSISSTPLTNAVVSALINAVTEMRPVLVLDLDETIIYCTQIKPKAESFAIRIGRRRFFIQVRPGFNEFFQRVSAKYEIFFFTASKPQYADAIIENIAPSVDANHRFFNDSCTPLQGVVGKDLSLINRPLNRVLLIDDICCSGCINPKNFIKIKPWMGEENDNCLCEELLPLLESIYLEQDIPCACRKVFCREQYPHLCLYQ